MMKRWFVRLVALVFVASLVLGVAPTASAAGDAILTLSNNGWYYACGSIDAGGYGLGLAVFDLTFLIPQGYKVVDAWAWGNDAFWGSGSGSNTFIDAGEEGTTTWGWWIGPGGWVQETIEIYAPDGNFISGATFTANCADGGTFTANGSVYGPHEPDPAHRWMGTVLANTPVYSTPDPAAALKDALKAGQTWFAVGQQTGTDGQTWYQIYVGGWNNAWVPASVFSVPGLVGDPVENQTPAPAPVASRTVVATGSMTKTLPPPP